jgi:glycosyltransferase involved in cell wall biosynthesis
VKISVVSPVFNEQDCVRELCLQLCPILEQIADEYEIVLVDDGSHDGSWQAIVELGRENGRIRGVRFSRNFGHHYAITAGMDMCDGDWVVVMDSDLQDLPSAIPDLLAKAMEGWDVVLAHRDQRQFGRFKNLCAKSFYAVFRYMTESHYKGEAGVFRIMSRPAVHAFRRLPEVDRFFPALIGWVGFRQSYVRVKHGERFAGETKYPLRKQISLAVSAMLSFSEKPLVLVAYAGLVMVVLSFAFTCYIVIRAIFWSFAVLGYASILASIFFVGGLILLTLGLVGLYVGRIFREVKGRPLYIVAETAN